ncbi:MAG: aldolase/citrate lyase family protein [Gemmatimonadota bacterium]
MRSPAAFGSELASGRPRARRSRRGPGGLGTAALPFLAALLLLSACGGEPPAPAGEGTAPGGEARPRLLALWSDELPAFGVYVPDERPRPEGGGRPQGPPVYTREGGRALASNPLYDFLFLNLEGAYDPEAVRAIRAGSAEVPADARPTLLVRIPPISAEGEDAARARVREILSAGADGVVLPHIRSVEEARTALGFFREAGADVWSPSNPDGRVVAMLMLEDPDAVAAAAEVADLDGLSVLACGIGSLTQALGGDREAAEAGNRAVLAEATRAGLADMITANAESIEARIEQGFLALLMQGPTADDVIRQGRAAAGR